MDKWNKTWKLVSCVDFSTICISAWLIICISPRKKREKNLKGDMERTKILVHVFTSCEHWSIVWWPFWLILQSCYNRLKQATHHESLIYGKGASVDCRLYSLRWMSRWNSINARVYAIVGSLFKWWFWGGGVLPKYTWLELFKNDVLRFLFFLIQKPDRIHGH